MIRQKRINKQHTPFQFIESESRDKSKTAMSKRTRKIKRCDFKVIPLPSKFLHTFKIYLLHGGILLTERNNVMSSEISLLTNFNIFRNIEIIKSAKTKLVNISVESKEDTKIMSWEQIVERLEAAENEELNKWAPLIKNFSVQYENFMKSLNEDKNKSLDLETHKKDHLDITAKTQHKVSQLIESSPCIHFKYRFQKSKIMLTQIIFNESMIKELGYSLDSFVTTVFQEGLPQFLPYNTEYAANSTKMLLENYFNLGSEGLITSAHKVSVFMKSGYAKKAKVRTHYFTTYEDGNYGIDAVLAIKTRDEAFLNQKIIPKKIPKQGFLHEMVQHEQDQAYFLSAYYDKSFALRYTNLGKVCTIKELPPIEDDFN